MIRNADDSIAANVRVVAFDQDIGGENRLGEAVTDAKGAYRIAYTRSAFRRSRSERGGADVLIRVYDEAQRLLGQSAVVPNAPVQLKLDFTLPAPFSVSGTLTDAAGRPTQGLKVLAMDRDLRSEQALGEAVTDHNGRYAIAYGPSQFGRAEKASADLVVRVVDAAAVLVESEIVFNAPASAEVNLQIVGPQGPRSEFERYTGALQPLLVGQAPGGADLGFSALTEEDCAFLSRESGVDQQRIVWLRTAFAFAEKTQPLHLSSHANGGEQGVPAALFYGWFREGIPDQWELLLGQSLEALRRSARAAIGGAIVPASLDAVLERALRALPLSGRDALGGAMEAAGIEPAAAEAILRSAGSTTEVSNVLLARLVGEGKLDRASAHRVGLAVASAAFSSESEAAAAAILRSRPLRGGKEMRQARDLAALDAASIEKSFIDAGVKAPDGMTLSEYSGVLEERIAQAFPADAMLHRASRLPGSLASAVKQAFAGSGDERRPGKELRAFFNLHPGLDLHGLLKAATDAPAALKAIEDRVGWVSRFHEANADVDLLSIDYTPGSADLDTLRFEGLPDEARTMLVASMKAYQRVMATGTGAGAAAKLIQAGYRSQASLALAQASDVAQATGLPVEEVLAYQVQAESGANDAALAWFALHDMERDAKTMRNRSLAGPASYLKQLSGYTDLFGRVDFCRCDHCRSVLGPAAYFVDLMNWVERHILHPSFAGVGGEQHALHLRSRRSDLWDLELTCDNTNKVVPSLDLVNDLLEKFILGQKQLASVAHLYERLATVDHCVALPFSLPMERLSIWLSHLGISRHEIASAFLPAAGAGATRAMARLGMSDGQLDAMTNSRLGDLSVTAVRAAEAFFSLWLGGANLTLSTIPGETETRILGEIDVPRFSAAARMDRETAIAALLTRFVNAARPGAPNPVYVEARVAAAGGVQNDSEWAFNLTSGRIDRFEAFARLWRHVPWTVAELDEVLARLPSQGLPAAPPSKRLHADVVRMLGRLIAIQDRLKVPVDELIALWGEIPSTALRDDLPLMGRVYNMAPFLRQQPAWPDEGILLDASPAMRGRLVAALQIDDADLQELRTGLEPFLGRITIDTQGNVVFVPGLQLSARNLSILYRHARLARLLGLSIQELLWTVELTPAIAAKPAQQRCILGLDDLEAMLAMHAWRVSSGFSLAEVRFVTRKADSLGGVEAADSLAARIAAEVAAESALRFGQDVFASAGFTAAESAQLVRDNLQAVGGGVPLLERAPGEGTYRITLTIEPGELVTQWRFGLEPRAEQHADIARELYRIVRQAGDPGFTPGDLESLGLDAAGAVALVNANLSTVANDGKPFEMLAGAPARYRRRAAIPEADAMAGFGASVQDVAATKAILRRRSIALILQRHAQEVLAAKASAAARVSPEKSRALLAIAMPAAQAERQALAAALDGGPRAPLSGVLDRLLRHAVLFRDAAFDADALEFFRAAPVTIALAEPATVETVRRASQYAALAAGDDPAFQLDVVPRDVAGLRAVLSWGGSIAAAASDAQWAQLAVAVRADVAQVREVLSQVGLETGAATAPRVDELSILVAALALRRRLGVPAATLRLIVAGDHARLMQGADGAFSAIRAKYESEGAFREKLEPFEDKLRSRTRDGLVDYVLSAPDDITTDWRRRFRDANDLYHHFLTDVMVEGCARTSKVVAATLSVQLYVQRVLMNLEQSDGPPPLAVGFDRNDCRDEWSWRKNYQVWVANRKVFLYPENYIEPGLRDDKTPLFRELEDTLLQQQLTEQNVLDAYAAYLHGFEQAARLRIAGAYHDRRGANGDLLHLFGVTAADPPEYFYRTVRNLESGSGPVFSAWRKVDLQIPARKVSAIVLYGRLHVFWVETTTRQLSGFQDGDSKFLGYRHTVRMKFSVLGLNGHWSPPQALSMFDEFASLSDTKLIDDRINLNRTTFQDEAGISFSGDLEDNEFAARLEAAKEYHDSAIANGVAGYSYSIITAPARPEWDDKPGRDHSEPLENYKPEGARWDRIYPSIVVSGGESKLRFGFFPLRVPVDVDLWSRTARQLPQSQFLPSGYVMTITTEAAQAGRKALSLRDVIYSADTPYYFASTWLPGSAYRNTPTVLLTAPESTEVQIVNGNERSAMIEPPGETLLLLASPNGVGFDLRNMGTSLAAAMGARLVERGVNGLLDTAFQASDAMKERPSAVSPAGSTIGVTLKGVSTDANRVRWTAANGAFAAYFREVFLHIPFLIADHLNSQQKFADAQRWYHYLFDPTAADGADAAKRPWRYLEFRETGIQKLRDALTDPDALAAYRSDPFNPDAIARLRPGAYQKSIFMKYIDNLLDWGDSLFARFTMEAVNEATMLYVMAADILGPRPVELGPCAGDNDKRNTYAEIAPLLSPSGEEPTTDFLIEELETLTIRPNGGHRGDVFVIDGLEKSAAAPARMALRSLAAPAYGEGGVPTTGGVPNPAGWNRVGAQTWRETSGFSLSKLSTGSVIGGIETPVAGGMSMRLPLTGDPVGPPEVAPPAGTGGLQGNHIGPIGLPKGLDRAGFLDIKYTLDDLPPTRKPPPDKNRPPIKLAELVQSRVIFCIPENAELLGYWDRVQDRLAKIRNCMDISGARRRLELFAPEIDPRLLVRMRAAGLSLDDVLNAGGDSLPPYRFAFLVEKARQYAGVAQAFGSQLLAALEKRDGEELARLRTVHEQNILKLRSQMTTWEIDAAKDALESLRRQQAAAEYRRDYFLQLQADGLSAPERVHQVATYAIATIATMEAAFAAGSAIAALLPNAGAPTAMTYGGREVSGGLSGLAHVAGALSTASRAIGETASIESSFQRRTQEWKHQVELAQNEIRQLATQITAAEIRRDIATESLKVHERSIEQVQEIFDFLRDRFTSFGRYTWLAAETQRLHRVAFNAALSMARLAEQACQFERPDEGGLALAGNYWEAGNAGLLAGDRLLLDLQNLERRHIETHQRTLEIEQSFSLARFAPDVLSTLKRTCSGQFAIPEWFFDMTYPGHYRRRIKAVRLSIPCVVGPYVNVGATLRLTQSYIRKDARLDSRVAVPLRHTSTIAASNAQSDAGVFEFSFRDERYLPFEGAGVDSEWELALPKVVRAFDYGTISDVILTISYAAEADDTLRQAAEGVTGVLAQLSDAGITRVLSLRHEFPDAWSALASGETQIPIEIRDAHVPFFLSPFDLEPVAFELLVEPVAGQGVVYPTLSFDSQALSGPGPDAKSALYSLGKSVATTVRSRHTLAVSDLGSMRKNVPGAVSPGLDESKVRDIALRVVLKRKKPQ